MEISIIEVHLKQLDALIGDFPIIQKLEALNNYKAQMEESVQEAFETPEEFERKIRSQLLISKPPQKKKKISFFKWVLMLFFGSQILFVIGIIVLVIKFTPIVKIDESKNHVMLLGGLIDINGQSGRVKIFDQYQFVGNNFSNQFNGEYELTTDQDEVILNFQEGIFNIKNSKDQKVTWDCKLQNAPKDEIVDPDKDALILNFKKFNGSCDIEIPLDSKVTIDGGDGQITFHSPQYDLFTELKNGTIKIILNPEVQYQFDIEVKNGSSPKNLSSSKDEDAFEINIQLNNGSVFLQD